MREVAATPSPSTVPARVTPGQPLATIVRGHLSVGREIHLGAAADGLAVTRSEVVWVSLPARSELVEIAPNRPPVAFSGINDPGPLAAGAAGVWVGDRAANTVALFAGHRLGNRVALPGRPVAIALDRTDRSAWVADDAGGSRMWPSAVALSRWGPGSPLPTCRHQLPGSPSASPTGCGPWTAASCALIR